jgi:hypothetical protein
VELRGTSWSSLIRACLDGVRIKGLTPELSRAEGVGLNDWLGLEQPQMRLPDDRVVTGSELDQVDGVCSKLLHADDRTRLAHKLAANYLHRVVVPESDAGQRSVCEEIVVLFVRWLHEA